jgi:hypothetical protein
MSSYSDETPTQEAEAPAPPSVMKKPRTNGKKMTDAQKDQLKKHMEKQKKAGMSLTEQRSHRMKMMGRMRKGESLNKAHKSVMSS